MPSHIKQLAQKQLLKGAPSFLAGAVQYEVVMGSVAYGVNSDDSDFDLYGFAIASKEDTFPHLRGEISGFDPCEPQFQHFQQHHIFDSSALGGRGREYDLCIYSITKYFKLLTGNNPNIIDSLFVPQNCILHSTPIANLVRDNRKIFLHKGCWAKFKGYAYGQLKKIKIKNPTGKRLALVEQFGYDVKFAYHVVRLLNEVEQILAEQDLDLQRSSEQLKAIRSGQWSYEQIEQYFNDKNQQLEQLYVDSKLPATADIDAIRALLLNCLEQYYGSLDKAIHHSDKNTRALYEIKQILAKLD